MPRAGFKDLCMDATDPVRLATFWGGVLGRRVEVLDDGDAVLRGEAATEAIWVNRVPEPKTVKHRLHLDVSVASLGPLVAAGATVVLPAEESGFAWTVMADPEGGEFCAFVDDDVPDDPPARVMEVVLDTPGSDASRELAGWWAAVLGGVSRDDGRGFWWAQDIPGLPFDAIVMVPVPEPKTVKNRLHFDIVGDVPAGATVLAEPAGKTPWTVCADPQGNEFCVFAP